jgi:hypothetical protein
MQSDCIKEFYEDKAETVIAETDSGASGGKVPTSFCQ